MIFDEFSSNEQGYSLIVAPADSGVGVVVPKALECSEAMQGTLRYVVSSIRSVLQARVTRRQLYKLEDN